MLLIQFSFSANTNNCPLPNAIQNELKSSAFSSNSLITLPQGKSFITDEDEANRENLKNGTGTYAAAILLNNYNISKTKVISLYNGDDNDNYDKNNPLFRVYYVNNKLVAFLSNKVQNVDGTLKNLSKLYIIDPNSCKLGSVHWIDNNYQSDKNQNGLSKDKTTYANFTARSCAQGQTDTRDPFDLICEDAGGSFEPNGCFCNGISMNPYGNKCSSGTPHTYANQFYKVACKDFADSKSTLQQNNSSGAEN